MQGGGGGEAGAGQPERLPKSGRPARQPDCEVFKCDGPGCDVHSRDRGTKESAEGGQTMGGEARLRKVQAERLRLDGAEAAGFYARQAAILLGHAGNGKKNKSG